MTKSTVYLQTWLALLAQGLEKVLLLREFGTRELIVPFGAEVNSWKCRS